VLPKLRLSFTETRVAPRPRCVWKNGIPIIKIGPSATLKKWLGQFLYKGFTNRSSLDMDPGAPDVDALHATLITIYRIILRNSSAPKDPLDLV
jgi:hypothetical protein